ncbi:ATP-dependent Lon protease [Pichia kluyveri]|uniref:Lon protease homolog, mitochondrial n=1 Tax=Pichia kluyveri TaxID=36015 RepID=A0AAV5R2K2_PICKL|nr:ATP-dependent Lon protease [Pichia kluyveri]
MFGHAKAVSKRTATRTILRSKWINKSINLNINVINNINCKRFASNVSEFENIQINKHNYNHLNHLKTTDLWNFNNQELQFLKKDSPKSNNAEKSDKSDKSNDKSKPKSDKGKDKKDKDIEKSDKSDSKISTSSTSTGSSTAASGAAGSSSGSKPPSDDGKDDDSKSIKNSTAIELPEVYPQIVALPISRRPLFPGFYKAVIISDVNVIKAIKESLDRKYPFIGCFLFKDENMESDIIESKDQVFETGVLAQITSNVYTKDKDTGVETLTTVLYPHKRIRIDEIFPPSKEAVNDVEINAHSEIEPSVSDKEIIEGITGEKEGDEPIRTTSHVEEIIIENKIADKVDADEIIEEEIEEEQVNPTEFLKKYQITLANVSNVEDEAFVKNDPVISSLTSSILDVLKEMSLVNKSFSDQLATFSASLHSDIFNCPEKLADFAAAVTAGNQEDLQKILECTNIAERLEMALTVLKKELMNKEMQKKIEKDIEERMAKRHREYHLNEQLKWIKKELGIDDGRDKLIAKYNERVKNLNMPEEVKKIYDEEINKLQTLETVMSEFTVTRNYLDWLTQIPWGKQSVDNYNIKRAKKVLDEDHYGLKDVKDRIVEFIAVGKLLNKINGKIICFVGPPGVGKTSIGKSIANSLNREFYRFSVGGLSDVAEIKGHRRTYVGAIPGRVVQALKKTQTENPLILIDEIDKISHSHSVNGGDPSAALLELLDPEQNGTFLDNYMDIPIDLSKVLFVCTANTLSTIPGPLLDRMEVIEISGYIEDEKIKIAEKYLAPEAKKNAGLENVNVELTEEAIKALIKNYCRESGVRNLKKKIDKIYRKAALNAVESIGEEEIDEIIQEEKESILPDGAAVDVSTENKLKENKVEEGSVLDKLNEKPSETTKSEETKTEGEESVVETKPEEKLPQIVIPDDYKAVISSDNLKDFVGVPVYTADRLYETTVPGVVMGLAWTSMGGSALYIESILEHAITKDSHAKLERTGQLGDVMKESVRIAYSFSKMFLAKHYPDNKFFDKAQIHLHCPEGATPKDGPSAGITITSSFLSLALNKSLKPDVAMTGEITLTGKVLRIGGLKEKTIAAKRAGVKTIIFPKGNESDWKELPDNIKEGMIPVPADWYQDVFDVLFQDVTKEEGNTIWKAEFDKIKEEEKKDKDNK